MRRRTVLGAAPAALLAACATPATEPAANPADGGPSFPPNPNLYVEGIPPIPQSLVERVKLYTDFRGHIFVDWHPTQRELLVAHRKAGDNTAQLYRLTTPMAPLEQLTAESDPVTNASYEPRTGAYIVFARSKGGNEAAQLYRLDPLTHETTIFTDPDERHAALGWLHGSSRLVYSSVPLDRTAQGGKRAELQTTLTVIDPKDLSSRRRVTQLPGGGWFGGGISHDDRFLAMTRYVSAEESEAWLVDLTSGERKRVLPLAGDGAKATHFADAFRRDGSGLFFISDRADEFRELMFLEFASGRITRISADVPWDVSAVAASEDGRFVLAQFNVDGRDELRLYDAATLRALPLPNLPSGGIGRMGFHPARNEIAFALNSAQGPSQVYSVDADRVAQWTRAYAPPGIDPQRFADQQIVRWKSFDGRMISGLLSRPPARFKGPRPVVIEIHGGPEGQATVGFLGRDNYFVEELGAVYIQPNVRGSSGYGKTFGALDNGFQREDSVKDIGALLDWIATQRDLDTKRVLVTGGSYGGYMALAVAEHYAARIAGAVDEVGISHFITFLNNTESYRRDLRRAEYGDEREPKMRDFLERISPLTNAEKLKKPLFVVQGRNDPRVPYTEAEQIVAKARAQGTAVWYLRAENEGHGFARKENADFRFYAIVRFAEMVFQL